ncbi:BlaI/MecI/CopY family transcriptional regulator [Pseudoduganella violaceinigra]|uniref:BlaI/MecI/CopY family transcriptional regulator n=1 Tax=Pseudoduganella violaceinigra TaxID=246602 RepID=UPI000406EE4D|nr:BlaI/MecI/CopY family transcriptional regulator [Pseudoduganella violaceinigra]
MAIQISEAEALVMEVLWQRHPQGADDICAALAAQQWQDATVKTLLNRLLNKGAIGAEKDGRRYLYTPLLKREQWLAAESKGFLDRMFDGKVAPLVAHFSRHRKLGKADIAELKRLIEELDNGK